MFTIRRQNEVCFFFLFNSYCFLTKHMHIFKTIFDCIMSACFATMGLAYLPNLWDKFPWSTMGIIGCDMKVNKKNILGRKNNKQYRLDMDIWCTDGHTGILIIQYWSITLHLLYRYFMLSFIYKISLKNIHYTLSVDSLDKSCIIKAYKVLSASTFCSSMCALRS